MTTALVTGASSGIGKEFCEQLAARGDDLVVVARTVDRLTQLAVELRARHGVEVEVLPADLTDPDQLQAVARRVADADRPVDLLVNNAGYGLNSPFLETAIEDELHHLDLHVRTTLVLSHAAAGAMARRGQGAIVNVSSVASFMASGTYSAAKSWVTVFSESLATQVADSGVRVIALCPGFTHTEFHQRAGITAEDSTPAFMWLNADRLVRDCFADLEAGKVISVPGRQYKVATALLRHAPRALVRNPALGNRHRPRST